MNERTYCSQQNSTEPLAGTADHVDVWLLLEYRPVWKARAHNDNDLSPVVRRWVDDALRRLQAEGWRPRLQFVRQPELELGETRLLVGVDNRLLQFNGSGYAFLNALDIVQVVNNAALYPTLSAPNYFVCTNGQRDICCARFGLRSYVRLRELVGDRVWQITHLGGHRFAPNLLVFPDAALYGRVGEAEVSDFVSVIETGSLDFRYLRGRSCYPPHVQAAEIGAGRSDLKLLHVAGDEKLAQVTFAAEDQKVQVRVQRDPEPLQVSKSCGESLQPVYPYRIIPEPHAAAATAAD